MHLEKRGHGARCRLSAILSSAGPAGQRQGRRQRLLRAQAPVRDALGHGVPSRPGTTDASSPVTVSVARTSKMGAILAVSAPRYRRAHRVHSRLVTLCRRGDTAAGIPM